MAAASVWLLQQQLPPPRLHSNHPSSYACPPSSYKSKHAVPGRSGSLLLCTSSSSSVVTKEQEGSSSSSAEGDEGSSEPALVSYKDDPNFRGCRGCGRDELERGCNGEGRIQGGIAAVPGLGWWPIKAYRPCPGFVASGGRYRRQGQSMDDVASGTGRPKKKLSPPPPQKQECQISNPVLGTACSVDNGGSMLFFKLQGCILLALTVASCRESRLPL